MYKICHSEESSRRQRMLEAGLLEAMGTHPYRKITLTDLCRQMNIPRKSFYRYFPTKEDCLLALIDHTLSDCNAAALSSWQGDRDVKQVNLEGFFRFWQERRTLLDALRFNGMESLLLERTTLLVDAMIKNGDSAGFARNQVEYFIAYGLMTVVLRWHAFGFSDTAENMAAVFAQLLSSPDVSMTRLML